MFEIYKLHIMNCVNINYFYLLVLRELLLVYIVQNWTYS